MLPIAGAEPQRLDHGGRAKWADSREFRAIAADRGRPAVGADLDDDFAQLDALMSHLRNEHSKKLNSYYRLTREFGREMLNQFVLR